MDVLLTLLTGSVPTPLIPVSTVINLSSLELENNVNFLASMWLSRSAVVRGVSPKADALLMMLDKVGSLNASHHDTTTGPSSKAI